MNKTKEQLETEIYCMKVVINTFNMSSKDRDDLMNQRKSLKWELHRLNKLEGRRNKILRIKGKI
jgi:hypothetical protein